MYNMTSMMKAAQTWQSLSTAYARMLWSANEVIWRRTLQMTMGTMKPEEFTRMVMEKPTAFAKSMEMVARAQAGSRGNAATAMAAIKPIGSKTRSNARRLRKSS